MAWNTVFSALALLTVLSAGCAGESETDGSQPDRPSIVLITIDTLRADRVGEYNCPKGLTPNLDALALKSVVFMNAITPIATTAPAHASLFTGKYPRVHRVRWNGDQLSGEHRTLAELLNAAGYDTAAFIAWPNMIKRNGLGRGFMYRGGERGSKLKIRPGVAVNSMAGKWLEDTPGKPFFMWIHYFEVHSPYRLVS